MNPSSDGTSALVDDLQRLAARLGWSCSTNHARPSAEAGPDRRPIGLREPERRTERDVLPVPDDEVLIQLRRSARGQQDEALRLSKLAQSAPGDVSARARAVQAWQDAEARWRAVGAYEGARPIPGRSRT